MSHRQRGPIRRILRHYLPRFALLFGSLLVCLAIVEGYLRWTLDYKPDLELTVMDFDLGKRLKPFAEGERHFGVPVKINSHGMRDREFDLSKPADTHRIIALGDSWTLGFAVLQDETWPKRLEAILAGDARPGHVEVLNTGVAGYETYHEAVYYERDLRKFAHDMVLVGVYPVNDVHDKTDDYAFEKRLYDIHPLLLDLYSFPSEHLYIGHWYRQWRKDRELRRKVKFHAARDDRDPVAGGFLDPGDDWTRQYDDEDAGWQLMHQSLLSIGKTARSCGVRGVVALFPDLRDLERYRVYCHPRVAPRIEAAVAEAGLTFVDLLEVFQPFEGHEERIAVGEVRGSSHPNAKGHELIAQGIARALRDRSLWPPSHTASPADKSEDK